MTSDQLKSRLSGAVNRRVTTNRSPAVWDAAQLEAGRRRWTFALDNAGRRDLLAALKKARDPGKQHLDYRREDFDLGSAGPTVAATVSMSSPQALSAS